MLKYNLKGEEKDWLGYLLPQGYSSILNARPSQQIDVDWGNSVHQLRHIMSNAVASKLFAEKSILCVGPEMVPQPKGKRVCSVGLLNYLSHANPCFYQESRHR